MVNIEHVGSVVKQKDGKPITNNIGEPCCYFTVGFAAPFHKVRLRDL